MCKFVGRCERVFSYSVAVPACFDCTVYPCLCAVRPQYAQYTNARTWWDYELLRLLQVHGR